MFALYLWPRPQDVDMVEATQTSNFQHHMNNQEELYYYDVSCEIFGTAINFQLHRYVLTLEQ